MGEAGYPIPCFGRFQFCAISRNDRECRRNTLTRAATISEDLGLNKVKFSRFPLWMLLKWSPQTTFDDFCNPPLILHFPNKFSAPPIWILRKFSAIPPFGFLVTTDPPFCSPKNQVIPPIIPCPPRPHRAINNDRSLNNNNSNIRHYCSMWYALENDVKIAECLLNVQ